MMIRVILYLTLFMCSLAQDLHKILLEQVDAYNKMDIDRLVDNVTADFKYFGLTSDTLMLETIGKEAFKKSMIAYYKGRKSAPISKIESYTIVANRITFKETVSHKNKDGQIVSNSALGIYQIRDGKISRAWYFYD